jgi:DinB superfamily
MPTAPDNPYCVYVANATPSALERQRAIDIIEACPDELRSVLQGLTEAQLATVYKNWTISQIVHHLGDSHSNGLLRFKVALTADTPRIFGYDPSGYVALADSKTLPISVTLQQLDAVHARWVCVLRSLGDAEFARGFFHPEPNRVMTLAEAVGLYAWHGRHHIAQIRWLREHRLKVS